MATTTTILVAIDALNRGTAQLAAATGQLGAMGAASQRTGAQVATMNKQMHSSLAVTRGMFVRIVALTAATAALGFATRGVGGAAIDFENSFVGIRKTVQATEEEFVKLARANRDLALELPVNVNEINKIGQIAGQLGIRNVQNIVEFERVMAMLGVTTNLTAEDAATSLARIAAVMNVPISQMERMGSAIVFLGNNFETTEAEIVAFSSRIAGVGSALGLTVDQIFAIGAAATASAVPVERGGTAVQKVLIALQKAVFESGDELKVFTHIMDMTEDRFRALVRADPGVAFLAFVDALSRSGEDAVRILDALGLSDARLQGAFLSLAGSGDKLIKTMVASNNAMLRNSELMREFGIFTETTSNKAQVMRNNWNEVGITLGQELLPAMNALSEIMIVLSKRFDLFALAVMATVTAIAFLMFGPFGLIPLVATLTFVGFRWKQMFEQLPGPAQDAAIEILTVFDAMANGIITATNTIIASLNGMIGAFRTIGGVLDRLPDPVKKALKFLPSPNAFAISLSESIAGIPDIPQLDVGEIDTAGAAKTLRAIQSIKKMVQSYNDFIDLMTKVEDEVPRLLPEGIEGLDELLESLDTKKAKKEVDILADGIISLSEALEHGISAVQAAVLELEHELGVKGFANELFRSIVELDKANQRLRNTSLFTARALVELRAELAESRNEFVDLQVALRKLFITSLSGRARLEGAFKILLEGQVAFAESAVRTQQEILALQLTLGPAGLSGSAASFINALVNLGQEFRRAEETMTEWHRRLAQASLQAMQTRFDQIFNRPSREQAQLSLALAEAQRRRALLIQSGAPEDFLAAIDEEINRIQNAIDIRRAEEDILRARAQLADATLLSEQARFAQAQLLIGLIAEQSEITKTLNLQIGIEILVRAAAIGALVDFTAALETARDVVSQGRLLTQGNSIPAGDLSLNVRVNAGLGRAEIIQTVNRELNRQMDTANFGGSNPSDGTFVPG